MEYGTGISSSFTKIVIVHKALIENFITSLYFLRIVEPGHTHYSWLHQIDKVSIFLIWKIFLVCPFCQIFCVALLGIQALNFFLVGTDYTCEKNYQIFLIWDICQSSCNKPNFTNPKIKFPRYKVFFISFNTTSYVGGFGFSLIYLEKFLQS